MSTETVLPVMLTLVLGSLLTHLVAEHSRVRAPVWASFGLHVFIGFTIYAVLGFYVPDAGDYDEIAQSYVAFWNHDLASSPNFTVGKEGWVLILAGLYFALGHVPLVGVVVNAMASAITTSLVMGTTSRIGRPDRARVAGWLSLSPQFLLWASLLLRESLAWMLTAVLMWAAVGIVTRVGRLNAVLFFAAFAGMLWIRGTVAVVLVLGIGLGVIASLKRVPSAFLVGAVAIGAVGGPLVARVTALTGGTNIEGLNAARASLTTARSGFGTTAYSDPVSIVQSLPNTFPRALLGPYPWELPSLPAEGVIDLVTWLILLALAWRGWRSSSRGKLQICAIPAICLLAVIGATAGNYGTMIRLRVQATVLIIPMAAVGSRRTTAARSTPTATKSWGTPAMYGSRSRTTSSSKT